MADGLAILHVVHIDLNRSVEVNLTFVVGNGSLFYTIEGIAATLSSWTELGDIVEPEHHVL